MPSHNKSVASGGTTAPMKILILNGPNLNLLGQREPHIYGHETMDHCLHCLRSRYPDVELLYYQSNHEGDLIDQLQQTQADGVVLNAGAYTHTSVAWPTASALSAHPWWKYIYLISTHAKTTAAALSCRPPAAASSAVSAWTPTGLP